MAAINYFSVARPDVFETSQDALFWSWAKFEKFEGTQPGAGAPQGGESPSQYLISLWGSGIGKKQAALMMNNTTQKMEFKVSHDGTTNKQATVSDGDAIAINNWGFYRGHHDATNNEVVCWEDETNTVTVAHSTGVVTSATTKPELVIAGNGQQSGGAVDPHKNFYGLMWQAGIILPATTTNWDDIGDLLYNSGSGRTAQQCLRDTSAAEQTNYGLTDGRCWFFELNEASGDTTSKITSLTLTETGDLQAICGIR